MSFFLLLARAVAAWRGGAVKRALALLLACFGASGAAGAGEVYLCPGNRFTDRLDAAQAQAQGCRLASAGRLSVAGAMPLAPQPAAPTPAVPEAAPLAQAAAAVPAASVAPPSAAQPRVAAADQRARDSDARAILQTELARTVAAQQTLVRQGASESQGQLQRLRQDEVALRRELSRLEPRAAP